MTYLGIHPALFCRTFFAFVTVAGLGASAVPSLSKLVSYGPRTMPVSGTGAALPEINKKPRTAVERLERLVTISVPHTWFWQFYMVSVASSAFWAYQLATTGYVFLLLASPFAEEKRVSMTMTQIIITWMMMAFQGSRRLYESIRLLKPSAAQMPLSAYALGIAFYLVVGVCIWAEGIPTLLHSRPLVEHSALSLPSAKAFVAIPLFLVASWFQHDSHVYLASLKKYTLPDRHLFRWILCPHYTCECAIYLALAIVAAPHGQVLNTTLSTVLIFTVANLAVTANSTRAWYAQKFGEESIKQRARMVPYIY